MTWIAGVNVKKHIGLWGDDEHQRNVLFGCCFTSLELSCFLCWWIGIVLIKFIKPFHHLYDFDYVSLCKQIFVQRKYSQYLNCENINLLIILVNFLCRLAQQWLFDVTQQSLMQKPTFSLSSSVENRGAVTFLLIVCECPLWFGHTLIM